MAKRWLIEIGANDSDGFRDNVADLDPKTTYLHDAFHMGYALNGLTVFNLRNIANVETWPHSCPMDSPVKGFSVVLYDDEEGTDTDTYLHFDFV